MSGYLSFNGLRFSACLRITIFILVIPLLWSCGGSDTPGDGTSDGFATDASETGSASFSIQWRSASGDSEPPNTFVGYALSQECIEGVTVVSCQVYNGSGNPIASGGPWPCRDHGGSIERIPAGPDRRFAVLGWNTEGGEIIYQGTSAGVDITAGDTADVGTIDANPFVPTGLGAQEFSDSRIDLAWDDFGVAGYRIYRDGTAIGTSDSLSFADQDLSANTQFCYTIAAYDAFGNESGPSGQACATTLESFDWYRDGDQDGYGDPNDPMNSDTQPAGYVSDNSDCNDNDATIYPGAAETCNGADDNCDGNSDEGVQNTYYGDSDGDGFGNASNAILSCTAQSGYVSDNTDCDDNAASIHPGATESCNGDDDDCDGDVDEGVQSTYYHDSDGDGYGDPTDSTEGCSAPSDHVTDSTDCNDAEAAVNPGATEIFDGIDNDCDGSIDEDLDTYYRDADGDGYGNPSDSTQATSPPPGYVSNNSDCDDTNATVHPNAGERCNGIDDDCDGGTDEGVQDTYYHDSDGDGYGDPSDSTEACATPSNHVTNNTDCDDTNVSVHPNATETCNGIDDDCDGNTDEGVRNTYYHDYDRDGYGDPSDSTQACAAPSNHVSDNSDCDDNDNAVHPNADEACNGVDDDCDGDTDEGVQNTYFHDFDGDGYGDPSDSTQACSAPSDHVSNDSDCNDDDINIYPGADDVCGDGIDSDCDGQDCTGCYPQLPPPVLVYAGSETLYNGDTRYYLEVTNSNDFPDELFTPAPHLPPCGSNTNSSRTWVEIDDDFGRTLDTLCGLSTSSDLNSIWFDRPSNDTSPPESVFIVIDDRGCDNSYWSNSVDIRNPHSITDIVLTPDTPYDLYYNEDVNITFNYYTTEPDGVRIFVRPYTNGALTPNYAAHPSGLYPSGSGSGSGYFTITDGYSTVDQLRFRMYNEDQSELLLEFFVDVSYSFHP